ncbi:hypothetical protein BDW42DRAFT_192794 [Aspergillus taichungensis]|uniref:Uncharacterized protein n=1 Tax=Aspergillus taichungensis TaxID=482145 RepID=A0A2J5HZ87_9EURO|nr:hypothetical protein BDW42DRAFT_192794 [Aspergillus taichungensis]
MTKGLTFDIRYDNELAHDYYRDGADLAAVIRDIYRDRQLHIPDAFESTLTTPPIHFMEVEAPEDIDVDELRKVDVPPGLSIEIQDFHA